jgi:uncharacterized protein YegP (UPF0339 family)
MSKFILSKTEFGGGFIFNLSTDGVALLASKSYTSKFTALRGIESVVANSQIEDRYSMLYGRISLCAGNSQEIAHGWERLTDDALKEEIGLIKRSALAAVIEDLT